MCQQLITIQLTQLSPGVLIHSPPDTASEIESLTRTKFSCYFFNVCQSKPRQGEAVVWFLYQFGSF